MAGCAIYNAPGRIRLERAKGPVNQRGLFKIVRGSQDSAQALLSAPDIATVKGLRDRAILAVLLSCGLRRSEVAALTLTHVQ